MLNQSLFCRFHENKNIIVSSIIIKKNNYFYEKKKFINLFLNLGFKSNFKNYLEKQIEKEILFSLNRIIRKDFINHAEKNVFLNIYLVIIKKNENLMLSCTNCIYLTLINSGILNESFLFQKSFHSLKNMNNLMIHLNNNDPKTFAMWSVYMNQIITSRLICKIFTIGLLTKKFVIYAILYFSNFKIEIKINFTYFYLL
jgi:hypothetical protein